MSISCSALQETRSISYRLATVMHSFTWFVSSQLQFTVYANLAWRAWKYSVLKDEHMLTLL